MWPIQVVYCWMSGLSVPNWWSSACTADGAASGPRIERAGYPGSTWAAKKMVPLRSNSVISARPTRLRMNRVIRPTGGGGGASGRLVGVLEEDGRQRGGVDPLDAGGGRRQPVDEVGDDDRRLVEQQRLDLSGQRL